MKLSVLIMVIVLFVLGACSQAADVPYTASPADVETPDEDLPGIPETPDEEAPEAPETPDEEPPEAPETPDEEAPEAPETPVEEPSIISYAIQGLTFSMIPVPGALSFPAGTDDSGRETVESGFYIGETEVSYVLWNTVRSWAQSRGYTIATGQVGSQEPLIGNRPFPGANQLEPVTKVTWYDAVVWCNALTEWINAQSGEFEPVYYYQQGGGLCKNSGNLEAFAKENNDHKFGSAYADPSASGFRLPAGKEWELAARWQGDRSANAAAGFSKPYFCKGDSASGASAAYTNETATQDAAVYNAAKTAIVGSKSANALGLFDMSGNVYEWCYDWNPGGEGRLRVARGGSLFDLSPYMMQLGLSGFAAADAAYSDIGFRVVCAGQ